MQADAMGGLTENHQTRILVCDDDEPMRFAVSTVLNRVGFNVETANDGRQALEMIRRQPGCYRIVITDNAMPRLDGIGFVRQLRADGFEGKIVVLSGGLDAADYQRYTELCVDEILSKPLNAERLREVICQLRPAFHDGISV
jgi:CheY-like chemotaxis protein